MEDKGIKFTADKVKITGPKIDGGYSITFEVGQYEQDKIAEVLKIPQQSNLEVTVCQIK